MKGIKANQGGDVEMASIKKNISIILFFFVVSSICFSFPFPLSIHPVAMASPGDIQVCSSDLSGLQGNGISSRASTSSDGRFVAFSSTASNLIPGDTNNL